MPRNSGVLRIVCGLNILPPFPAQGSFTATYVFHPLCDAKQAASLRRPGVVWLVDSISTADPLVCESVQGSFVFCPTDPRVGM